MVDSCVLVQHILIHPALRTAFRPSALLPAGDAPRLISKYRPKVPVLVITSNERVVRQCAPVFALYPYVVDSLPYTRDDVEFDILLEKAVIFGIEKGLCLPGKDVVVVHGAVEADAEGMPMVCIKVRGGVRLCLCSLGHPAACCRTCCVAVHSMIERPASTCCVAQAVQQLQQRYFVVTLFCVMLCDEAAAPMSGLDAAGCAWRAPALRERPCGDQDAVPAYHCHLTG